MRAQLSGASVVLLPLALALSCGSSGDGAGPTPVGDAGTHDATTGGSGGGPGGGGGGTGGGQTDGSSSSGSGGGTTSGGNDGGTDGGGTCATCTRAYLFGGNAGGPLGDTWSFDGTSWREESTTGPSARDGAMMATLGSTVYLFGGSATVPLADTWKWTGAAWAQVPTSAAPAARANGCLASFGDRLVLFGGDNGVTSFADTWEFDGTTWTLAATTGPSARSHAACATSGGALYLYGGTNDSLWKWGGQRWDAIRDDDGNENTDPPYTRADAAAAGLDGVFYLYGGSARTLSQALLEGDTWSFTGGMWTQVATSGPPARAAAAMTVLGDRLVLFGGVASNVDFGDTWLWDSHWTAAPLAGDAGTATPGPRHAAAFAGPPTTDSVPSAPPAPSTLATQAGATALALVNGALYISNPGAGTISKVDPSSGAITPYASNLAAPTLLAAGLSASDTFGNCSPELFWWSSTSSAITAGSAMIAATHATEIATNNSACGTVLWSSHDNGTINYSVVPSTSPTSITGESGPVGVALGAAADTDYLQLVWADYDNGTLRSRVLDNQSSTTTLASGGAFAVTLQGTMVFWTAVTAGSVTASSSSVMAIPQQGGTPLALATGLTYPDSIAADAAYVYFTDVDAGKVLMVSSGGGKLVTLAGTENKPTSIVQDAAHVYWLDGSGNVRLIAK